MACAEEAVVVGWLNVCADVALGVPPASDARVVNTARSGAEAPLGTSDAVLTDQRRGNAGSALAAWMAKARRKS